MASTTDMNIVLGQGTAIKEIHNVRKQNLELNQQFVAQQAEDKKKEDRVRVQEFEAGNRIEIQTEEEEETKDRPKRGPKKRRTKQKSSSPEGKLIDIRV